MAQLALINAFQTFMDTAHSFVAISNERDYRKTLDALEQALEFASDTEIDPLNPLIDMLSHAIEKYESLDEELMRFVQEAEAIHADIALLRTLMDQYHLTGKDLPEIGSKSMVCKVLKGERDLSRSAIEKLSARFNLQPAWFFD